MGGCVCSKQNTSPYGQEATDKKVVAPEESPSTTIPQTNSGRTSVSPDSRNISSSLHKTKIEENHQEPVNEEGTIAIKINPPSATKNEVTI